MVAVSLKDKTSPTILREIRKAGVDVCELRIDRFASSSPRYVLKEMAKFKKLPVLATIRSKKEGGKWRGSESKRLELYRAVIPKAKIVDIELSSRSILKGVVRAAKKHKKPVIVSYHNFKGTPTPQKLNQILRAAKVSGAVIVKIAAMARGHKDVQTLLDFTKKNAKKKIITIAMGEKGAISRILFPRFGSLMTYASLDGKSMAPGQLDYKTTLKLLGRLK